MREYDEIPSLCSINGTPFLEKYALKNKVRRKLSDQEFQFINALNNHLPISSITLSRVFLKNINKSKVKSKGIKL